jgi:flagellar protein FlbD
MIELHRLCARREPFWLNPDLVATIEANPDTVIALTTGTKVMVCEPVEAVVERIKDWRSGVLEAALHSRHLAPVR